MWDFCLPDCYFIDKKMDERAKRTEKKLREREPTAMEAVVKEIEDVDVAPIQPPIDLHPSLGPIISFNVKNNNVLIGENGSIGASSTELEIKEGNATKKIPIQRMNNIKIEGLTMSQIHHLFLEAQKSGEMPKAPNPELSITRFMRRYHTIGAIHLNLAGRSLQHYGSSGPISIECSISILLQYCKVNVNLAKQLCCSSLRRLHGTQHHLALHCALRRCSGGSSQDPPFW